MLDTISRFKIMPILRGTETEDALFLTECFQEANINLLEVSLNQPNSYLVLEKLCLEFGKEMKIGAGTVLSEKMARQANDLGAEFLLGPNTSKQVMEQANQLGIPYIPGALTPTEIQYAHDIGAELIKIFPVRQLGISYIRDVLASLNKVNLLAVGGVGPDNFKQFLNAGVAGVGIGSSLLKQEWIEGREKKKILEQLKVYKSISIVEEEM